MTKPANLPVPPSPSPLTPAECGALLADTLVLPASAHVAVACSGGADSLALTYLLHQHLTATGGQVTALHVNHGLRAAAAAEAAQTSATLRRLGIPHHLLLWQGVKPRTGIQAAARQARYDLLRAWCQQAGVLYLLTAHHLADNYETIAQRQARGATGASLAGMARCSWWPDIVLLRPLLTVPKARLVATVQAAGLNWVEDPSNHNPRFERVRWRQTLTNQAEVAASLSEAKTAAAALDDALQRFIVESVEVSPFGIIKCPLVALTKLSLAGQQRFIARAIQQLSGASFPPKQAALQRLLQGTAKCATLGGCIFEKGETLTISREPAAGTFVGWHGVAPSPEPLTPARAQSLSATQRGRLERLLPRRYWPNLPLHNSTLPQPLEAGWHWRPDYPLLPARKL